jgi:hypothetical protein
MYTSRIYYQNKPERLSACPLTIHALLHIADSIKAAGPVWCYWAFPMERFCGSLQPAIRSRRHPYTSLDRFICESSQLRQIANVYDIAGVLALRPPLESTVRGGFSHPQCTSIGSLPDLCMTLAIYKDPSCILLPPRSKVWPADNMMTAIASVLATRFDTGIRLIRRLLANAEIEEWGKVRRVDSDAGDTMHASFLGVPRDDARDATYVRVRYLSPCVIITLIAKSCSMRC